MTEKRMLIVDAEVLKKVDENRGDMSHAEFISFLIDSQLNGGADNHNNYVDREEYQQFERGIKELLRNFLEFFISYGLELGKEPQNKTCQELSQKLQALGSTARAKKI